jgi:hypothetical protein
MCIAAVNELFIIFYIKFIPKILYVIWKGTKSFKRKLTKIEIFLARVLKTLAVKVKEYIWHYKVYCILLNKNFCVNLYKN